MHSWSWRQQRPISQPRTPRGKGGQKGKGDGPPQRSKALRGFLSRIVPVSRAAIGNPPQKPWSDTFEAAPTDPAQVKDFKARVYRKMDQIEALALSAHDAGKCRHSLVTYILVLKLMAQSCDEISVQLGKIKSMRDVSNYKLRAVRDKLAHLQNEEPQLLRDLDNINLLYMECKDLEQCELEEEGAEDDMEWAATGAAGVGPRPGARAWQQPLQAAPPPQERAPAFGAQPGYVPPPPEHAIGAGPPPATNVIGRLNVQPRCPGPPTPPPAQPDPPTPAPATPKAPETLPGSWPTPSPQARQEVKEELDPAQIPAPRALEPISPTQTMARGGACGEDPLVTAPTYSATNLIVAPDSQTTADGATQLSNAVAKIEEACSCPADGVERGDAEQSRSWLQRFA
ncbi:unnamed protein product [Prorocentrum cordatum]|uniref:Uncharacterized protein n=1 Tax=Prorocentrum cordatum TaxID=2364126 RepID=A0ABN9P8Z0_9DINO|nr:unnamed protein product [Polarella glacialis]